MYHGHKLLCAENCRNCDYKVLSVCPCLFLMSLDPALKGDLIPLLHILLVDKIPAVLSCALSAWEHVCPERTDLLHRSYRQICRVLIEMDEWGQLVAMRVLIVYVRRCFNEPHEVVRNVEFYDNPEETGDPDLELLYKCALQLLHSRSSAVPPPL